jgi:plastocyanin
MKRRRFTSQRAALVAALGLSFASVHCGSDSNATPENSSAGATPSSAGAAHSSAGASEHAGAPSSGGLDESAGSDSSAGAGELGTAGAGDEPEVISDFNGCTIADYEDHSGVADDRTIGIATMGLSFTPKCLTIQVGQTVTWAGSLAAHPLGPGNADHPDAGTTPSPIIETSSGQSVEFTFTTAGTFPYYCEVHSFGDGMGMAGVVHVKP